MYNIKEKLQIIIFYIYKIYKYIIKNVNKLFSKYECNILFADNNGRFEIAIRCKKIQMYNIKEKFKIIILYIYIIQTNYFLNMNILFADNNGLFEIAIRCKRMQNLERWRLKI